MFFVPMCSPPLFKMHCQRQYHWVAIPTIVRAVTLLAVFAQAAAIPHCSYAIFMCCFCFYTFHMQCLSCQF